jgi:hypothetical protein
MEGKKVESQPSGSFEAARHSSGSRNQLPGWAESASSALGEYYGLRDD